MNAKEQGFISLLAVLIVGALATATAITMLSSAIDSSRQGTVAIQQMQARNAAHSCAEEALQQIHDDVIFSGTHTLNLGDKSCTYTVSATGQFTRSILAQATINNVNSTVAVYATIGISSISIISWQEVSN